MYKRISAFALAVVLLLAWSVSALPVVHAAAGDYTGNRDWAWPVPSSGSISSCYIDPLGHTNPHYAIDIVGAHYADVVSCSEGRVLHTFTGCTSDMPKSTRSSCPCGVCGDLGNAVYVAYESHGTTFVVRYGHLAQVFVRKDDPVTKGQVIGSVGSTGRSGGYHLDLRIQEQLSGIRLDSSLCVDPLKDQFLELPEGLNANGASSWCTCCAEYVQEVLEIYSTPPGGLDLGEPDDEEEEDDGREDWPGGPAHSPIELPGGFADVDSGAYYCEPVLWAVEKGITNGTSTDTFSPEDDCLRSQVVTFLWRAEGCPEPDSRRNPFRDVDEDAYYYKAVLWALENGITTGVSADRFGPDEPCTREQVVTFLYRTMGEPRVRNVSCPFTDVEQGSWYETPVLWAVKNGVTNGVSADAFGVGEICTRAQIVTFLYRTYEA